jgi:hypothetical protein
MAVKQLVNKILSWNRMVYYSVHKSPPLKPAVLTELVVFLDSLPAYVEVI